MNTTVNAVLFKSKTLSNGAHPLMIRICQNNKKKYKSLGISIHAQYWDFEKNKPKRNCPNKEQIINLINDKIKEYSEQIIEFKSINKEFTVTTLVEKVNHTTTFKTVHQLFETHIQKLKEERRTGYALSFNQLFNSLLEYNGHLDISFSDIDVLWLKHYESWLRLSKGITDNTIAIRMRTLRALYNVAVNEKFVKAEYYPFKAYRVSKLAQETLKRSINKSDIEAIINYKTNHEYTIFSIDLFLFSYLSGGINFVDLANLKSNNIINNQLVYTRKKTKKLIKIPLQPKALELITKYSKSDNPYLFPIFSTFHKSDQQKANRVHKVITKVNNYLKEVGKELNIPITLTTYVARHPICSSVLKISR